MFRLRVQTNDALHYDLYFMSVPGKFVETVCFLYPVQPDNIYTYCDKRAQLRIVEREETAVARLRYNLRETIRH
jgi:hypothetical protein